MAPFIIDPKLPWRGEVIAFAKCFNKSHFIVTRREEAPQYVVHRYELQDGSCHGGNYCDTISLAMKRFNERVAEANAGATGE